MKTVAFFNNKGGVGKTSLVYHLAWMMGELGYRVVAVDLDPQANLSGIFLNEEHLDALWDTGKTIDGGIAPLFDGTGDISDNPHIEKIAEDISDDPHIEKIEERIGLLVGDLALSRREDELSTQWMKCVDGDVRAFHVMTAFSRLINLTGENFQADFVLIDVGPNLGAINRAALIASDYVVMPLAPDLFSLQGLRNAGPMLNSWRTAWQDRIEKKPENLNIDVPGGYMRPLGYVVMRHSIRLNRPVRVYLNSIDRIPEEYRKCVTGDQDDDDSLSIDTDKHMLAHLKDYRSLMPMAQEANKPMFMLKPADGAIGAQQNAVMSCYKDFRDLAKKIIQKLGKRNT